MMWHRRNLLAAAAFAWPAVGRAQAAWPRQSIRFVVPFAPGDTSEIEQKVWKDIVVRAGIKPD